MPFCLYDFVESNPVSVLTAIIAPSESSPFCLYALVESMFVSALTEPVLVIVAKDIPVPADTLVIVPSFFALRHALPVQTYNDESDI
jgi:hypothetical protein